MCLVPCRTFGLALAASLSASVCTPQGDAPQASGAPDSLGFTDFATSCDPSVRDEFNRGVALLHHMTYPVAQATFESVTDQDPDCAMGYWGAAMTLFQPLWPTRPSVAELERGWELIQEARQLGPATEREDMFVRTAEAFFDPSLDPDYWARIERWAAATTELYRGFPDDIEARAFHALARLATASRFGAAAEQHAQAYEVLATVLREEPTHPGAVHYTIHANDFTGRQDQALDVVRSYGEIAPNNPHALHMPSHIFVLRGDWDEVISWNVRAAQSALGHRVGPSGEYTWDEFPHAGEYLVYAYLQQGRDEAAANVLRDLTQRTDLQPSFKTAFHLASTSSRYVLERKDWSAAADLPVRSPDWVDWDQFRWPEAVRWFTKGLAASHIGDEDGVARSIERLEELVMQAHEAGEPPFAAEIEILLLQLRAWDALRDGLPDSATELLVKAIELHEATPKHPVTPGAQIPPLEMLGDLYLEVGDPRRAWEAYQRSDALAPGRFNTTLGLARSALALGDEAGASEHYARLARFAGPGVTRDGIAEASEYLGR